jgi:hypothetical protein
MALGDKGLQDLTLQEGYKKLLISENTSGIDTGMNKISTSVATNIAGSTLYMGVDNATNPALKIKTAADSAAFFYIESGGGTDLTAPNAPMLTAWAGGSGMKNGVLQVHNILNVISTTTDMSGQAEDGMGQGQICFGITNAAPPGAIDSTTKTWATSVGSVFVQGTDIMHRTTGVGNTSWWKFDRVRIANSVDSSNVAFRCDATEALFSGLKATGKLKSESNLIATGGTSSIQSSDDIHIRGSEVTAGSTINIIDTTRVNVEARDDAGSAVLNLNSVSSTSAPQASIINIGITDQGGTAPYSHTYDRKPTYDNSSGTWTTTSAVLQGPTSINIGQPSPHAEVDATVTNRQILTLNSAEIKVGEKTTLKLPYVLDTSSGGWEPWAAHTDTDENAIYFTKESTAENTAMFWYDGINTKKREVETTDHLAGRTTRMSKVTTAVAPESEEANIYVKGGKLIVAYNDPLGTGSAPDVLYYWVDLTKATQSGITTGSGAALTQGWQMSTDAP